MHHDVKVVKKTIIYLNENIIILGFVGKVKVGNNHPKLAEKLKTFVVSYNSKHM